MDEMVLRVHYDMTQNEYRDVENEEAKYHN